MSKVYFKRIDDYKNIETINNITYKMLEKIVAENDIAFKGKVPLKVHFGERGNKTFIEPDRYDGIKKYLKDQNIESCYIETNVLYKGSRTKTEDHIKTAREHGFTDLDIVIADSDPNNQYHDIEVNLKHFDKCKIGAKYADYDNYIIISHFKGHGLAGMGAAIKQLGMGFASRGGKMNQHAMSVPNINKNICISCESCVHKCPVDAIYMEEKATIDSAKCIGCASCTVVCPVNAISNNWDTSYFHEKLAEYAYAATLNKTNIYITFAFNITENCDCFGSNMPLIASNIGIFASTDPVSIDQATLDKYHELNNGDDHFDSVSLTLDYADAIGLGKKEYELIEL